MSKEELYVNVSPKFYDNEREFPTGNYDLFMKYKDRREYCERHRIPDLFNQIKSYCRGEVRDEDISRILLPTFRFHNEQHIFKYRVELTHGRYISDLMYEKNTFGFCLGKAECPESDIFEALVASGRIIELREKAAKITFPHLGEFWVPRACLYTRHLPKQGQSFLMIRAQFANDNLKVQY